MFQQTWKMLIDKDALYSYYLKINKKTVILIEN